MTTASSAPIGIETEPSRNSRGRQASFEAASLARTRLESFVLLLTALLTVFLVGLSATQFQLYWN